MDVKIWERKFEKQKEGARRGRKRRIPPSPPLRLPFQFQIVRSHECKNEQNQDIKVFPSPLSVGGIGNSFSCHETEAERGLPVIATHLHPVSDGDDGQSKVGNDFFFSFPDPLERFRRRNFGNSDFPIHPFHLHPTSRRSSRSRRRKRILAGTPLPFLLSFLLLFLSWPQFSSADLHFSDFVGEESKFHFVNDARISGGLVPHLPPRSLLSVCMRTCILHYHHRFFSSVFQSLLMLG